MDAPTPQHLASQEGRGAGPKEGGRKLAEQEEAQGRGAELRSVRGSWWEKWGEADSGALDV